MSYPEWKRWQGRSRQGGRWIEGMDGIEGSRDASLRIIHVAHGTRGAGGTWG